MKHLKTLSFLARQTVIPDCRMVTLHTSLGTIRAEYVDGSEQLIGTEWQYSLWIDDYDLPPNFGIDQVCNNALIEPFVTAIETCCGGTATGDDGPHVEEWNFVLDEATTPVTARIEHWMYRIEEVTPTNFRAWVTTPGTEDLEVDLVENNTVVATVTIPAGQYQSPDSPPTFAVESFLPNAAMKVQTVYPNGSGVTPPEGLEVALRANVTATPS